MLPKKVGSLEDQILLEEGDTLELMTGLAMNIKIAFRVLFKSNRKKNPGYGSLNSLLGFTEDVFTLIFHSYCDLRILFSGKK